MKYCQNCGLLLESFVCPIFGHQNWGPPKGKKDSTWPRNGVKVENKPQPLPPKHPRASMVAGPPGFTGLRNGNSFLLFGGAGAFMVGLAATILAVIPLYGITEGNFMEFEGGFTYGTLILSTILLMGGCILLGLGLFGLYRHFGSYTGLVALIFSIVAPVIMFVLTLDAIEQYSPYYQYYYYTSTRYSIAGTIWVGHVFLAIMFILIGMAWRRADFMINWEEPNKTVGNLFIIAGFMFILFFGFLGIPWVVVSVAGFSAAVLFWIANPNRRVEPQTTEPQAACEHGPSPI